MKIRASLYRRRLLKTYRVDVPVISVGNLLMGGTGKTPFVIHLAELLQERGFRPAIVSRGYHGAARAGVNIVSDGSKILMNPVEAGDEPVLIAEKIPGAVVATGKKRYLPAAHVIKTYQANLILLDDGFQHLSLFRDIDFVLFDIDYFAGDSRVFPGGELREPVSSLKRCDAFVLTGLSEDNAERAEKITALLSTRFPGKRIFSTARVFSGYRRYDFDGYEATSRVAEQADIPAALYAFSGIAHPQRFHHMLESAGFDLSGKEDFGDHHTYLPGDIDSVSRAAAQNKCPALVTTEKDIVKLDSSFRCELPIYVPALSYEHNQGLIDFISERLANVAPPQDMA